MYSSYKKKRAVSQQQVRAVFFVVFAIIAVSVFFFSYRFYQHASGSSVYSIGKGNKYVNMISNSLYGPEIEEKEEEKAQVEEQKEETVSEAPTEIVEEKETNPKSEWVLFFVWNSIDCEDFVCCWQCVEWNEKGREIWRNRGNWYVDEIYCDEVIVQMDCSKIE